MLLQLFPFWDWLVPISATKKTVKSQRDNGLSGEILPKQS
jgi:hypothetical protein